MALLPTFLNLVALVGRLASPPTERPLPSGDRLVAYELTIPVEGGRAETVPVVWLGAPGGAADMEAGATLVVLGRVRRRFFRGGAGTQSRTEVVAEAVVRATGRRGRTLLAEAARRLGAEP